MASENKKTNRKTSWLVLAGVLILGIFIGHITGTDERVADEDHSEHAEAGVVWTCSMHPQIRESGPGNCPICGMELIPVSGAEKGGENGLPAGALKMSQTARQLAGVQTVTVQKGNAVKEIILTGRAELNPRFTFTQSAHFSGRIEELYVSTAGETIQQGQKTALIYSPELITAWKELLQAYDRRESNEAVYLAVRDKLKLWKIPDAETEKVLESGTVPGLFPLYAGESGFLLSKNISRGDYVQSGMELLRISRPDSLWGVFDIFEKDAPFIKNGSKLEYQLSALPGRTFRAEIDYAEPVLDPELRTIKARILIDNPDLTIKPGMLLSGTLYAGAEEYTGKIIIPKSAVMWTGKRSVVYVQYENNHEIGYMMRKVVLGPALGTGYVVEEGLQPGEKIVSEGTFSVDAAAQLADYPSMMNPEDETDAHHDSHEDHNSQAAHEIHEETNGISGN